MISRAATALSRNVLVVHGEDDRVVPLTFGKRLYDLIRSPKRFVSIARAGHSDLGARAVVAAKQFVSKGSCSGKRKLTVADMLGASLQAPHSTFIPARVALHCHSSNADRSFKAADEGLIGR